MGEHAMTVAEFCTKHCAAEGDNSQQNIQRHVDTLVLGAMTSGFSLWRTGIDGDGRVSLIWSSMPEEAWEHLLSRSLQVAALQKLIGDLL